MSDSSPRLGLPDLPDTPELYADTVADAFARIDAFTDLYLKGQFVNTPPSSPADGDCYLTGGSPTGAWSGQPYKIAACRDGGWTMLAPFNGLRAFVEGSNTLVVYQDGTWLDWASLLGAGESSIAAAAICDIGAAGSLFVAVTGTTTITSLGTAANRLRFLRFAGALTLTHNAASLILPGAANIATAAGDTAIFTSDGSGNWRCRAYTRADGRMVNMASPAFTGTVTAAGANWTGQQQITVNSAAANPIKLSDSNTGGQTWFISQNTANYGVNGLGFFNNGAGLFPFELSGTASRFNVPLVIDGKLGIGVVSPTNLVDADQSVNGGAIGHIQNGNSGSSAFAAWEASNTGNVARFGMAGGNYATCGAIAALDAFVQNSASGGIAMATATNIKFGTVAAEWARFGSDGSFLVGTQTNGGWLGSFNMEVRGGGSVLSAYATGSSGNAIVARVDNMATALIALNYGSSGVGSVTTNGTAVAYNTTSDARLKTVMAEQGDYRGAIRALWVGDFTWKDSGAPGFGVLAQQAWEVMPHRMGVTRPDDESAAWQAASEPFGQLALWGVKDLYALVEALAARVAVLEAAHDAG